MHEHEISRCSVPKFCKSSLIQLAGAYIPVQCGADAKSRFKQKCSTLMSWAAKGE
ncbi:hypothetical protein JI435_020830 [Parastagonospora nodorum SN15]|uniref:Uncharacterized protein n=1 Tax=Phaeosphaeria nodorum (strain SN15 / ATCC MYA-4574 / FGSC 10173) TaxID=321614 RepID=A0A7U2HXP3_PHANO|nr:hypothetical protein JI435_020830 [Parastagonospora nodorum SN15]